MAPQQPFLAAYSFGPFDVDPQTEELKKHGMRLRLPRQSFQVLLMLLERPGRVVPRDELQQALWRSETFVDFEKGLNAAVNRLRDTLGDSAEDPRYVETLPRRGYRFIAPVEKPGEPVKVAEPSEASGQTAGRSARFPSIGVLALLFSLVAVLFVAVILPRFSRLPVPAVADSTQITNDRVPKEAFKIVSDGTRVYFGESLPSGSVLMQASAEGGEATPVALSLKEPVPYDISTAGSELLVGGGPSKGFSPERPVWVVPLPAGSPQRVGDILGHDACWMPNGRGLVFVNDKEVFFAKADGSDVRKLATLAGFVPTVQCSPDGSRVRFTVLTASTQPEQWQMMEVRPDGSGLRRVPVSGCCGVWSANGKYYFYQADLSNQHQFCAASDFRNIWALPERPSITRGVQDGAPVQLTSGPLAFGAPAPSPDGKHLFVVGHQDRIEMVRYENRSSRLVPFLPGISAGELAVSRDGQWIAYTTYPDSILWRSKLDGSQRLQLTSHAVNAHEPRWSPDGRQILFTDVPLKLFTVSADGGAPRQLMPTDHPSVIGAGAWFPDGNHILFGRLMGCPIDDYTCYERAAIYLLDLKTHQVSKVPGSDGLFSARLSPDGRYVTAISAAAQALMLYDFRTERWSELVRGDGSVAWSRDSKFVYLDLQRPDLSPALVRIRVSDRKIERLLDLKDISLEGYWPDWFSLLPDGSPVFTRDTSTQEIYRLDLQYR
jgi:DNA-binding winged helix-turn-helix (wHTH) protein/dipeptidyl aminopeptidase/acylaminoacyl peptidase